MEDLIGQSFNGLPTDDHLLQHRRYDLVGPNGLIILPRVWERVIQPGWIITMHFWPNFQLQGNLGIVHREEEECERRERDQEQQRVLKDQRDHQREQREIAEEQRQLAQEGREIVRDERDRHREQREQAQEGRDILRDERERQREQRELAQEQRDTLRDEQEHERYDVAHTYRHRALKSQFTLSTTFMRSEFIVFVSLTRTVSGRCCLLWLAGRKLA